MTDYFQSFNFIERIAGALVGSVRIPRSTQARSQRGERSDCLTRLSLPTHRCGRRPLDTGLSETSTRDEIRH